MTWVAPSPSATNVRIHSNLVGFQSSWHDFNWALRMEESRVRGSRTDAEARTIPLRYDALGRLVEQRDGLGRSTYAAYDELGNLVERVDGAGERLRYEHDARGRVVRRTSAGGAGSSAIDDRYHYDGFGRLVVARNAHTTLTYAYDALDRVAAVTDGVSGTAQLRYDADGRTVQAIYPNRAEYGYPEGVSVHYVYNARGQLQAVVDPVAGIFSLEHDAAGRLVRRIDPTGVERRVLYDDEGDGYGFVERVEIWRPGVGTPESYAYRDYDLLGNPGSIEQASGLSGGVNGTTAVSYDSRSRVRSVTYPGGQGTESFWYDKAGNRTRHVNRQGEDRTYVLDAAHQLTEVRDFTTDALVERFVYDGAGRRRQRVSSGGALLESYAYDARGALTEFTKPSADYAFVLGYDAMGFRRERAEATGLVTGQALYFGEWAEHRGGTRRRMVFGSGLGAPLAEVSGGNPGTPVVRGLYEDGTANVTHVASKGAGLLVFESQRRYEAFGARTNAATTQVERSFAGRPTEGVSGLLLMGARHYDPSTGTFLQVDPLVVETSEPYAYALQNPYRFWDPTGMRPSGLSVPSSPLSSSSLGSYSLPSTSSSVAYASYSPNGALTLDARSTQSSPNAVPQSAVDYTRALADAAGRGWMTDVQAVSLVADYLAASGNVDTFVDHFGLLLAGASRETISNPGVPLVPGFGQSGFDSAYQEPQFGSQNNQVRHFAAFVVGGYQYFGAATIPNAYREIRGGRTGTYPDFVLGQVGIGVGIDLYLGSLPLSQVGSAIRERLGGD